MELYLAQVFSVGNAIIDFFSLTDWSVVVAVIKVMSFFISIFFFAAIIYSLKKHRDVILAEKKKALRAKTAEAEPLPANAPASPESAEIAGAQESWQRIVRLWQSDNANDTRLAIIEADALLDGILKELRFPGENLGERLKRVDPGTIRNIEEVWFAHKLRNALVHDPASPIAAEDAERALRAFKEALRALKIAA